LADVARMEKIEDHSEPTKPNNKTTLCYENNLSQCYMLQPSLQM